MTMPASPLAMRSRAARRSRAVSAAVSSSTGAAAPTSRAAVSACWPARVSVGAISAPCMPASTARSRQYRATTVLPDPTSPCSSRRIGVALGQVALELVEGAQLVGR